MVTTRFYLDKRFARDDGTSPLKLRISKNGGASFLPLDISLPADQWDAVRQVVKKNCPNARWLNEYITQRKAQVDACIRDLILEGSLVSRSATETRDLVLSRLYPKEESGTFMAHYHAFAEGHKNARTRDIYAATAVSMAKYDDRLLARNFEDIDKRWLEGYRSWLGRNGCTSVNAQNIHLRNIRAAFNSAIDFDLTVCYPFRKVKIHPEATRKRSMSVEHLRAVFDAVVPEWQQKYIDAFKLIFLLIGINTKDLLGLKKEDYQDGRVCYSRAKTRRLYDVKVEPEAAEILARYPGVDKLLSFDEGCSSYRHWSMRLNQNVSKIVPGTTSYSARHSWATIAAALDIPKETIAAALGHGGNGVTDIYIDFDRKKVDEANRKVLDWVLYGKS